MDTNTTATARGSIYKITTDKTDKIYIGSTTQLLTVRLQQHFQSYHSYTTGNSNSYMSSYEIIKLGGNIQIILLESVLFNKHTKLELLTREAEYISLFSNIIVNIKNPKPNQYKPTKPELNSVIKYFYPNS